MTKPCLKISYLRDSQRLRAENTIRPWGPKIGTSIIPYRVPFSSDYCIGYPETLFYLLRPIQYMVPEVCPRAPGKFSFQDRSSHVAGFRLSIGGSGSSSRRPMT